jgi:hypothetical protein
MSMDSRNERNDLSRDWVKQQLQRLSAVEPPAGLKERLRAGILRLSVRPAHVCRARRWSRGAGWTGIAAAILVATSALVWLGAPSGQSPGPVADTNGSSGRSRAADHNSVLPPDIHVSDSNGLY